MTPEEIQALAVATVNLLDAKLDERLAPIKSELHLTRLAAERAADHGIEANTRISAVEEDVRVHGSRLDDHQRDLRWLGERVTKLERARDTVPAPDRQEDKAG